MPQREHVPAIFRIQHRRAVRKPVPFAAARPDDGRGARNPPANRRARAYPIPRLHAPGALPSRRLLSAPAAHWRGWRLLHQPDASSRLRRAYRRPDSGNVARARSTVAVLDNRAGRGRRRSGARRRRLLPNPYAGLRARRPLYRHRPLAAAIVRARSGVRRLVDKIRPSSLARRRRMRGVQRASRRLPRPQIRNPKRGGAGNPRRLFTRWRLLRDAPRAAFGRRPRPSEPPAVRLAGRVQRRGQPRNRRVDGVRRRRFGARVRHHDRLRRRSR